MHATSRGAGWSMYEIPGEEQSLGVQPGGAQLSSVRLCSHWHTYSTHTHTWADTDALLPLAHVQHTHTYMGRHGRTRRHTHTYSTHTHTWADTDALLPLAHVQHTHTYMGRHRRTASIGTRTAHTHIHGQTQTHSETHTHVHTHMHTCTHAHTWECARWGHTACAGEGAPLRERRRELGRAAGRKRGGERGRVSAAAAAADAGAVWVPDAGQAHAHRCDAQVRG